MTTADTKQEPDVHNYSPTVSHRLPTVTGWDILQSHGPRSNHISTSLVKLDQNLTATHALSTARGFLPGDFVEVYGPPGVGKTTLAIQCAANVLRQSDDRSHVLWVDAGSVLFQRRLIDLLDLDSDKNDQDELARPSTMTSSQDSSQAAGDNLRKFHYIHIKSHVHLLTLFLHPSQTSPPPNTRLIVVDDLSNMILAAFPRPNKPRSGTVPDKSAQKAASRRPQTLEILSAAMSKLAILRDLTVLVTNNCATNLKPVYGGGGVTTSAKATLKPALSGAAWESSLNTQIHLYRDFHPGRDMDQTLSLEEKYGYRLAQVTRLNGKPVNKAAVPFMISKHSLVELAIDPKSNNDPTVPVSAMADIPTAIQSSHANSAVGDNDHQSSPGLEDDEQPNQTLHKHKGHIESTIPTTTTGDETVPQPRTPIPPTKSIPNKRKAPEIADSDEEEEIQYTISHDAGMTIGRSETRKHDPTNDPDAISNLTAPLNNSRNASSEKPKGRARERIIAQGYQRNQSNRYDQPTQLHNDGYVDEQRNQDNLEVVEEDEDEAEDEEMLV